MSEYVRFVDKKIKKGDVIVTKRFYNTHPDGNRATRRSKRKEN